MKNAIMSRRLMLQGALAVGCCLGLTAIFSAKAGAQAAKKASQSSVRYQAQPKGEGKCGNCMNFIAETSTCKLVDGQISPEGWCNLWAKKA